MVDGHYISFLSRDMVVSKSRFGVATGRGPLDYECVLKLRKFMIRDQDRILDHLQPSKLLDKSMHTQISRATRVNIYSHVLVQVNDY